MPASRVIAREDAQKGTKLKKHRRSYGQTSASANTPRTGAAPPAEPHRPKLVPTDKTTRVALRRSRCLVEKVTVASALRQERAMRNEHGITTQYSFQEREQFCDFGGGVFLSSLVSHRAQKKTFQIRSYRSLSLPLGGAVAFLPVEIFLLA